METHMADLMSQVPRNAMIVALVVSIHKWHHHHGRKVPGPCPAIVVGSPAGPHRQDTAPTARLTPAGGCPAARSPPHPRTPPAPSAPAAAAGTPPPAPRPCPAAGPPPPPASSPGTARRGSRGGRRRLWRWTGWRWAPVCTVTAAAARIRRWAAGVGRQQAAGSWVRSLTAPCTRPGATTP